MTRRPYSDSTLDALAAAPDRRSVHSVLLRHRAMYRADAFIERLHVGSPSGGAHTKGHGVSDDLLDQEASGGWNGGPEATYGSQIGMAWTARMERYVGGLEWDGEQWRNRHLGAVFPWARAFLALGQMCRGVHHAHRDRSEFRGSLCRALVSLVIIGEQPIGRAARTLGIQPARAGLTLRTALLWMEAEISRQAQRMLDRERAVEGARSAREDAGYVAIPVHVHVPLPGLHGEECHNPVCKRERAA